MRNPTIPPGVTVENLERQWTCGNARRVMWTADNGGFWGEITKPRWSSRLSTERTERTWNPFNPPLWVENVTTAYVDLTGRAGGTGKWYVSTAGRRCFFDMYAKHRGSSVYHACVAALLPLAASKDKECDGQPPPYAWVQAGKPGKVSDGC